jgi:hypothetical protein
VLHKTPPRADTTTVLDASGLTCTYRRTVEAALPRGAARENFWADLRKAVETFLSFEMQRQSRKPPQQQRKHWHQVRQWAAKGRELLQYDPRATGLLAVLAKIDRIAAAHALGYEAISSGFGGRRDVHRAFFYAALCDLWLGPLDQDELRYSRSPQPSGPLIRFLLACAGPVMIASGTTAPSPHTVAGIIDRERRDRVKRYRRVMGF